MFLEPSEQRLAIGDRSLRRRGQADRHPPAGDDVGDGERTAVEPDRAV